MANSNKRNYTLDIVKGIAIILMVGGHAEFPIRHFIYLFHMAIFFMVSGFFFQSKYSDSVKNIWEFIKKRLKGLWLPYVVCNIIFSLLHNFFIKINFYTNNTDIFKYVSKEYVKIVNPWSLTETIKNILQSAFLYKWTGNYLLGAIWFLETLFKISILFCLIDFIIKKIFKIKKTVYVQLILSVIFLAAGFWCHLKSFDFYGTGLNKVFSYYILFYMGYFVATHNISEILTKSNMKYLYLGISFAVLIVMNQLGTIDLIDNIYPNPAFLIICSVSGWIFIYVIADLIGKLKHFKNVLVCLGQNTLFILVLHYTCFKIVSYIGVLVDGKPKYCVAAFPILYDKGVWWIAYMIVGITIPILIAAIWNKIKPRSKTTLAS